MTSLTDALLVINAGSSSVKYRVFSLNDLSPLAADKITRIGESGSAVQSFKQAFELILKDTQPFNIKAAAHRVVHGGTFYHAPVFVTPEVIKNLASLNGFAPLHQPHNLQAIAIMAEIFPDLPQFADFDTAFHVGHDPVYDAYALPEYLRNMGLRRFGFHGLSYQSICDQIKRDRPELYPKKLIIAHLGNGASICAVENGKSIDSTMGLTALEGLPMGTRSGSIDPGLLLFLGQEQNQSFDDISDILYHQSGLLGLSGISNDVKELSASSNPSAAFALDYFSHKVAQHVCMMMSSLGGMEALILTGGIGENSNIIRKNIEKRLSFLPTFESLICPTDEENSIARNVKELLKI